MKIGDRVVVRFSEVGVDERPFTQGILKHEGRTFTCYPKGARRIKVRDGKMWICEIRSDVWDREGESCIDVKPLEHATEDSPKKISCKMTNGSQKHPPRRLAWPKLTSRQDTKKKSYSST